MQLIQNGTQGGTSVPTKQAAVGTPGFGASGTPGSYTPTVWDADVANTILAELKAVLDFAGVSLDPTNNAQVMAALSIVAGASKTSFTSGTSTLTVAQAGLIVVDASGGNVTLNLPAATAVNSKKFGYDILRTDTSANTVTVTAPSGTIAPTASASILIPINSALTYQTPRILSDGSVWRASGLYFPGGARTSTSFWRQLPDGTIKQHVEVALGDIGTSKSIGVTYPTTFPTKAYLPIVSWYDAAGGGDFSAGTTGLSTSGCTVTAWEWASVTQNGTIVVEVEGY